MALFTVIEKIHFSVRLRSCRVRRLHLQLRTFAPGDLLTLHRTMEPNCRIYQLALYFTPSSSLCLGLAFWQLDCLPSTTIYVL